MKPITPIIISMTLPIQVMQKVMKKWLNWQYFQTDGGRPSGVCFLVCPLSMLKHSPGWGLKKLRAILPCLQPSNRRNGTGRRDYRYGAKGDAYPDGAAIAP